MPLNALSASKLADTNASKDVLLFLHATQSPKAQTMQGMGNTVCIVHMRTSGRQPRIVL